MCSDRPPPFEERTGALQGKTTFCALFRGVRIVLAFTGRTLAKCKNIPHEGSLLMEAVAATSEISRLIEAVSPSMEEVARQLGCDLSTLYRWKNGRSKPRLSAIRFLRSLAGKENPSSVRPARFTFIDLFSGIGGMRMGIEAVGGGVFSVANGIVTPERPTTRTSATVSIIRSPKTSGTCGRKTSRHMICWSPDFRVSRFLSPVFQKRIHSGGRTVLTTRSREICSSASATSSRNIARRRFCWRT